MLKNKKLAKHISDAAWGEFIRLLEYKCEWYGRHLVKVDQWSPTSKTCSTCSYHNAALTLADREWQCLKCHSHHDRDVNAALNIKTAGLAGLAYGADVKLKFFEGETVPENNVISNEIGTSMSDHRDCPLQGAE